MQLTFNHLVQKDLRIVLSYYEEEGGQHLADRFFAELELLVETIAVQPTRFHPVEGDIRRADLASFPYHILFRIRLDAVRILILRHHKRRPKLGLQRR
jgi:plasmid stabilization system protein ParE